MRYQNDSSATPRIGWFGALWAAFVLVFAGSTCLRDLAVIQPLSAAEESREAPSEERTENEEAALRARGTPRESLRRRFAVAPSPRRPSSAVRRVTPVRPATLPAGPRSAGSFVSPLRI